MPLPGITESFGLYDAMDENRGRDYIFRLDRANGNNLFGLNDGRFRRHSHDGIEIPGAQAVGQIAQGIRLLRFDERIVRVQGLLQNTALAVQNAFFLAVCDFGAHADGGVKPEQARGSRAHALAENALWHKLQGDFTFGKKLLEEKRVRAGKGSDDMLDLLVLEKQAELAFLGAAVVADGADVFRTFARQCLNEIVRETCAAKTTEHDRRAIGNVGNSGIKIRLNFLFHGRLAAVNRSATPLWASHRPVCVALKSCWRSARKSASSSTSISRRAFRRMITRAPAASASARCFAKLPSPK